MQASGAGVFKSIDGGRTWTYMGLEETRTVHRVIIHPEKPDVVYIGAQGDAWADSELVIGTFGRSAWVLDDICLLREMAAKGVKELDQAINLYPAPDAYLASYQQASGTRFAADAIFRGENRPSGARLTYSVVKPEEADSAKKEEEKVTIEIYNRSGEKIRTLEEPPSTTVSTEPRGALTKRVFTSPAAPNPSPMRPSPPVQKYCPAPTR